MAWVVVAEVPVVLELVAVAMVERSGKLFLDLEALLVLLWLLLVSEDLSYCMYRDFYDVCLSS